MLAYKIYKQFSAIQRCTSVSKRNKNKDEHEHTFSWKIKSPLRCLVEWRWDRRISRGKEKINFKRTDGEIKKDCAYNAQLNALSHIPRACVCIVVYLSVITLCSWCAELTIATASQACTSYRKRFQLKSQIIFCTNMHCASTSTLDIKCFTKKPAHFSIQLNLLSMFFVSSLYHGCCVRNQICS